MVISVEADLESAIKEAAERLGCTPEVMAIQALRERFVRTVAPIIPRDDWERALLAIGKPIGANLSNEALSSEGIYE